MPGRHDDQTLILADVARKALRRVQVLATELLERNLPADRAKDVAHLLATGVWTHDYPLMADENGLLGLPVRLGVLQEERSAI